MRCNLGLFLTPPPTTLDGLGLVLSSHLFVSLPRPLSRHRCLALSSILVDVERERQPSFPYGGASRGWIGSLQGMTFLRELMRSRLQIADIFGLHLDYG